MGNVKVWSSKCQDPKLACDLNATALLGAYNMVRVSFQFYRSKTLSRYAESVAFLPPH